MSGLSEYKVVGDVLTKKNDFGIFLPVSAQLHLNNFNSKGEKAPFVTILLSSASSVFSQQSKEFNDLINEEMNKINSLMLSGRLIYVATQSSANRISIKEQMDSLIELRDKLEHFGFSKEILNHIRYDFDKMYCDYSGEAPAALTIAPNKETPVISALILLGEIKDIDSAKKRGKNYARLNTLYTELNELNEVQDEIVKGGFLEGKQNLLKKEIKTLEKESDVLAINKMEDLIRDYAKKIGVDAILQEALQSMNNMDKPKKTVRKIK